MERIKTLSNMNLTRQMANQHDCYSWINSAISSPLFCCYFSFNSFFFFLSSCHCRGFGFKGGYKWNINLFHTFIRGLRMSAISAVKCARCDCTHFFLSSFSLTSMYNVQCVQTVPCTRLGSRVFFTILKHFETDTSRSKFLSNEIFCYFAFMSPVNIISLYIQSQLYRHYPSIRSSSKWSKNSNPKKKTHQLTVYGAHWRK